MQDRSDSLGMFVSGIWGIVEIGGTLPERRQANVSLVLDGSGSEPRFELDSLRTECTNHGLVNLYSHNCSI